jgi:hypothetical protein
MSEQLRRLFGWQPPSPAWGSAIIAGLGCALPLSLGLVSSHPGFLWAAVGAFQAARANPLHRFGMPRMLLLIFLGACGAGLGYWVAQDHLLSLAVFAAMGFFLAWLQRFGVEAAKLGLGVAVCLCLGQAQQQSGELNNPYAVAALFSLGGLWVALLAFGLRGAHGLRTWPYIPRLRNLLKVLRRHARRLPQQAWRLHALSCTLALGLAGLAVTLTDLSHGYWLSLIVLATLQLNLYGDWRRSLWTCVASLTTAILMILFGSSLQSPALMAAVVLPLIMLTRSIQANNYRLYMLQSIACCVLLAESLAGDWYLLEPRLLNALIGFGLAVTVLLLTEGGRHWLLHGAPRSSSPTPNETTRSD